MAQSAGMPSSEERKVLPIKIKFSTVQEEPEAQCTGIPSSE